MYLERRKKAIPGQPLAVELEARVLHGQEKKGDAWNAAAGEFAEADGARIGSVGLLLEQLGEADAAEQMLRQFVDRHTPIVPLSSWGLPHSRSPGENRRGTRPRRGRPGSTASPAQVRTRSSRSSMPPRTTERQPIVSRIANREGREGASRPILSIESTLPTREACRDGSTTLRRSTGKSTTKPGRILPLE